MILNRLEDTEVHWTPTSNIAKTGYGITPKQSRMHADVDDIPLQDVSQAEKDI